MAKRFEFEDEKEDVEIEEPKQFEQPSHIDELEDLIKKTPVEDTMIDDFDDEEMAPMTKKPKKKFTIKWWHYILIGFLVLGIAFAVYIFAVSSNDGPVYGPRCEGVVEVNKDLIISATDTIKKKYPEIESITMEIECKKLMVDIVFKADMKTKKAQSIAEESVQVLDDLVGKPKESGKTYSTLFSKINNVPQYEVNFYLKSENNDDFPMYATKHIQNDKFSYTLHSVKDKESAKKALDTKTQEKK